MHTWFLVYLVLKAQEPYFDAGSNSVSKFECKNSLWIASYLLK